MSKKITSFASNVYYFLKYYVAYPSTTVASTVVSGVTPILSGVTSGFNNAWTYTTTAIAPLDTKKKIKKSNNEQNDMDTNIQNVIHDYKKIRTRYNVNKQIIEIDDKYVKQIETITGELEKLNEELDDPYIDRWISVLNNRKTVVCNDLEILKDSQQTYKEFSVKEDIVNDVETLTVCSVCMDKKKDKALDCGHLYCSDCVNKLSNCPTCRTGIDKDKIRTVFI